MERKRYLMAPGPTPVPPAVLAANGAEVLHHRSPDFRALMLRTLDRLQQVCRTQNDVLLFTASGSAAFESAVVNLLSPGERVLAVMSGEFGERWARLGRAYGIDVQELRYEWGETPRPDDVRSRLDETGAEVAFVVQSETSTGVVADVEAIARAASDAGASIVVDAVSSLGALPLETDAWGLDVVVAGSQKALMTPPGLSVVTVSPAAWERSERATLPRFYFDWKSMRNSLESGSTPFTPAVTIVAALDVALGMLLESGLEDAYARHAALGRACREGAKAMGLDLFSPDEERSAVVTAILTPEGVDARELVLALRDRFGITVAGGHRELGSRMFRIGHIGYYDVLDITTVLAAVEALLVERGADIVRGAAVARALEAYGETARADPERLRVLVREQIAAPGLAHLRPRFDVVEDFDSDLASIIGDFDAIIVRSATKLDALLIERAKRLRVIGRAGVGVDNIDVDAATRRGIVVANAAETTVVSAAEHTIALILALARNVPQAHGAMKAGVWDRARFSGIELAGKTLGVLGLGRIGREVARRAQGLGMKVVAYDPFVTPERFRDLGVEKAAALDDVVPRADVITLHLPLNEETRGVLGAEAFARMRVGVRIVNTARGGLIDESALHDALTSGIVAGAALDVFGTEPYSGPLLELDNVVVTPHLAGSTEEAQDRAGVVIAEQVATALDGGFVQTAVNIPVVEQGELEALGPFIPLATKLGRLSIGLGDDWPRRMIVAVHGPLAEHDPRLLTVAALNGAFHGRVDEAVNYVNAPLIAAERGIEVSEQRFGASGDFTNLIRITITAPNGEEIEVSGTSVGPENRLFLTGALGFEIDLELAPRMVFLVYADAPGVIGRVGTLCGDAGVNIASMAVSRTKVGGWAMMVFSIDSDAPPDLVRQIRESGFDDVRFIGLG